MATIKCHYCNEQVDRKEAIKYKNYNYHPHCYEQKKARDELSDYICRLFGLKRPGPVIYAQISQLIEENKDFSYCGIKQALIYYYEVLKNPVKDQYKNTIGIVRYVYDDAQEHYKNLDEKRINIAASFNKSNKNKEDVEKKQIFIKKKPLKGKHFIDMNKLV